ncbi:hypothetical protein [Pampinifervens florentissimum]|uniref:hypothetical protein n=1 Tax=Pampinifervens florentissimum TaxID=1632019 RepID=UPI0013B48873|nr:hypothetical protein [Hydrogenobacter sp. T-8]QID33265.1 hypothetical protein G3M65_05560 [Hydrogenobacter sp. T-8]
MSLYLVGFFLYYCLPYVYVDHVNYSIPSPVPMPFQKQCACVINPKSVYNSPLGNPQKLQEELERKNAIACHMEEEKVKGYRDIGLSKWLLYFLFEYIPKTLLFEKPSDPYSLISLSQCKPLASDMPIIISLWKLDIPSYSFILRDRKNLYYAGQCDPYENTALMPFTGSRNPQIYAYSRTGFFFPGDQFKTPAVLSADFYEKRVLIFLLRNGTIYKVFDQRSIRETLQDGGNYSVQVYTYRFRLWRFYFGLRFFSCTPAFHAI